ncbi:MAG: hypothetical protein GZ086_02365 [Gelidibacter sp.]|nr:hypothetical protein [Gelidibacter sp.]
MFKKILKNIIEENKKLHRLTYEQLKELEWAHIYHDSIRGKQWLQELPLNIGRWAGNYTFFYVLNRILTEYKPRLIIEFGLGESSKFISSFLDNYLDQSKHLVIEQSQEWKDYFDKSFKLSANSEVRIHDMISKQVKGNETKGYHGIEKIHNKKFDLYIVDGPFGSDKYSRYDIVELAQTLNPSDDFIIIMDDYQREGEKQTVNDLEKLFEKRKITIYSYVYSGNKSFMVLATIKYKYTTSY